MLKKKIQSMLAEESLRKKMVDDFMLFLEAIDRNDTETVREFDEKSMITILSMMKGGGVSVYVDVPWVPPTCSRCKIFGHSDRSCFVADECEKPIQKSVVSAAEVGRANGVAPLKLRGNPMLENLSQKAVAVTPLPSVIKSGKGVYRGSSNQFQVLADVANLLHTETDVVSSTVDTIVVGRVSDDCMRVDSDVNRKVVVDNVVEPSRVLGQQVTGSDEVGVDESLVGVVDFVVEPEAKLKAIHSPRKTRNASLGVHQLLQDMKVKQKAHVGKGRKKASQESIWKRMNSLNVDVLCLLETRVKVENASKIVDRWFKGWGWLANYSSAVNGRIWLLWRPGIHVAFLSESAQCLSCCVDNNGLKFFLSAIYGCNDGMLRRQLWDRLDMIKGLVGSSPWLLAGDFNVFLQTNESSVACPISSDMLDFQKCLSATELSDFPCSGPLFTWSNHQEDRPLVRKLDRILTNLQWYSVFPNSQVEFLAPGVSDHSPGIIWTEKPLPSPPKPFKYGELSFKVVAARKEVEAAQLDILSGASSSSVERVHELKAKLFDLEAAERSFYKQKARISWLCEADQSSKFFYSLVKVKNKRQSIQSLISTNGTKLETQAQISNEIVSFFSGLLGSRDLGVNGASVQLLQELLPSSLSEVEAAHLVREFSDDEIRSAIFEQGNDKSPGPDGYSACFFKTAWDIVGWDFIQAIRFFFAQSKLMAGFNATTIVLVPKVLSPNQVKDFRPISAFVKGRNIVDNTLLAQELVRGNDAENAQKLAEKAMMDVILDMMNAGGGHNGNDNGFAADDAKKEA
ncbi:hypothetical protein GQ457_08G005660 [Hibiscus cannabinus]